MTPYEFFAHNLRIKQKVTLLLKPSWEKEVKEVTAFFKGFHILCNATCSHEVWDIVPAFYKPNKKGECSRFRLDEFTPFGDIVGIRTETGDKKNHPFLNLDEVKSYMSATVIVHVNARRQIEAIAEEMNIVFPGKEVRLKYDSPRVIIVDERFGTVTDYPCSVHSVGVDQSNGTVFLDIPEDTGKTPLSDVVLEEACEFLNAYMESIANPQELSEPDGNVIDLYNIPWNEVPEVKQEQCPVLHDTGLLMRLRMNNWWRSLSAEEKMHAFEYNKENLTKLYKDNNMTFLELCEHLWATKDNSFRYMIFTSETKF